MRLLLTAAATFLLVSLLPAATLPAIAQPGPPLTRVEVTKITPAVVDGAARELTVTGSVTNTSAAKINNLRGRAQSGSPLQSEAGLRDAIRGDAETHTEPNFSPVADSISPGQSTPFEIKVPTSGGPNSLQITQPGIYPILLNINGQLGSGSRARVGEAQFALPVTSVPGQSPAKPAAPTPMSMLIPFVDYPRVERDSTPGQNAILVDDKLSESLAPGGRLFELVQAADDSLGSGSQIGSSVCFAIDPDLLVTVNAMQNGYRVRQPDGSLANGIGAGAARFWLSKLQTVAKGRCVVALPYSDADLVALGRADLPDLIKGSLDGAGIVAQTLNVQPRTDVTWPIDGALDEPAASELANMGTRTVLTQPSAISPQGSALRPAKLNVRGSVPKPMMLPIDPLTSSALDPQYAKTGKSTILSPAPGDGAMTSENALSALAFRATQAFKPGGISVVAPPRRWNIGGDDLRALLGGLRQLADGGYVKPTSLPAPADAGTPAGSNPPASPDGGALPEVRLRYPVSAITDEIQRPLLNTLAARNYEVGDLFRSSERDPATNVQPSDITTPLRNGLLRGASSAWRDEPGATEYWLHNSQKSLSDTLSAIEIDNAPGNITLAASNSYIPITITNRLPLTVAVTLKMPRQNGVSIRDLGVLKIPAQGSRPFFVQAETTRPGKFTVDVNLHTEGGIYLGTRRLKLESTAYGPMSVILTVGAAAVLILLVARRIIRRFRGNGKTPDKSMPSTDAHNTDRTQPPGNTAATTQPATTDSDSGTS